MKSNGINERQIGWKIHDKNCWIESKNLQLTDDVTEDKKAKGTKKRVIKRNLKFENYKNFLEAPKLENKIKYLETNKINVGSLQKFIKNL